MLISLSILHGSIGIYEQSPKAKQNHDTIQNPTLCFLIWWHKRRSAWWYKYRCAFIEAGYCSSTMYSRHSGWQESRSLSLKNLLRFETHHCQSCDLQMPGVFLEYRSHWQLCRGIRKARPYKSQKATFLRWMLDIKQPRSSNGKHSSEEVFLSR